MPDPSNASEALDRAIVSPKSVVIQGQTTALPTIPELIEADQYQQGKQAAANPASAYVRQQRFTPVYE